VFGLGVRPDKLGELAGQPIGRTLPVLRDVPEFFEGREQVVGGAAVQSGAVRQFAQACAFGLPGDVLQQIESPLHGLDHTAG